MKISVVGLGLIGGSICKTIKKNTTHEVYGLDTNENTMRMALADINGRATDDIIAESDIVFVCLHPTKTIKYITENADLFGKNSIVCDVCGVKKDIIESVEPLLKERGVTFIGTHPMAGREHSGYEYALDNLFERAYFIITPVSDTPADKVEIVKKLAAEMKFRSVVVSTPEEHDEIIAYTSQLAHVVSNAYVKSPTLLKQRGFSAGSFLDLTRVAKLNEDMWTDLFLRNKQPLLYELKNVIEKLKEYEDALENDNEKMLRALLKDGRELKEKSLE